MFIAQFNFKEKYSALRKLYPLLYLTRQTSRNSYALKLSFPARFLRSARPTQKASER